jgi:hypothetical protein
MPLIHHLKTILQIQKNVFFVPKPYFRNIHYEFFLPSDLRFRWMWRTLSRYTPTFRDNLAVPPSSSLIRTVKIKTPWDCFYLNLLHDALFIITFSHTISCKFHFFPDCLTLSDGTDMYRNVCNQRRTDWHHGGSLKSYSSFFLLGIPTVRFLEVYFNKNSVCVSVSCVQNIRKHPCIHTNILQTQTRDRFYDYADKTPPLRTPPITTTDTRLLKRQQLKF